MPGRDGGLKVFVLSLGAMWAGQVAAATPIEVIEQVCLQPIAAAQSPANAVNRFNLTDLTAEQTERLGGSATKPGAIQGKLVPHPSTLIGLYPASRVFTPEPGLTLIGRTCAIKLLGPEAWSIVGAARALQERSTALEHSESAAGCITGASQIWRTPKDVSPGYFFIEECSGRELRGGIQAGSLTLEPK